MKNRIFLSFMVLSLLFINLNLLLADERPIYIGDIIELNIDSNEYTMSEIELAFQDFDIIEIAKGQDVYDVKVRIFHVGEHKVSLGNTNIYIQVESLLNDEENNLIEGDWELEKPGPIIPWTFIKYLSLILGIAGSIGLIILLIKDKPKKPLSGYELFVSELEAFDIENSEYIGKISLTFKKYLSSKLKTNLLGYSLKELESKIESIPLLSDYHEDLNKWFRTCDVLKYSPNKGNDEIKIKLKEDLIVVSKLIEENVDFDSDTSLAEIQKDSEVDE